MGWVRWQDPRLEAFGGLKGVSRLTPELMEEAVVDLAILTGYLLILCVGCLIADYVFPHIPFIQRFLDSLPDWEDEDYDE